MTVSPARILIVEDQYFVAADCEMQLKSAGFDCVGLATTATEAVAMARQHRPDLVLMDIRLAQHVGETGDGIDAAIQIYDRFSIRCIFCSGHADAWTHAKAERVQPLGWLDKPYNPHELIAMINQGLLQIAQSPPAGLDPATLVVPA